MDRMAEHEGFPEREWKILRRVHAAALDRFCERVLTECGSVLNGPGSAHERYRQLFKLLQERNEQLAFAFDDMRRSRAIERLAAMRALGVVTDEEMAEFSPALQSTVEYLVRGW
jgi:hypothetical protein